jgi:5-hydroxyisourate hydrolase
MSLSTHVLDASTGRPAQGVAVRLEEQVDGEWRTVAQASTDADGRIGALGEPGPGIHRLHFDTGGYFEAAGVATFYPEVTVTFTVVDAAAHHHVPLLLSPFAFSTYRGS